MPTKRFANLSPAQERVFEQIAINLDGGHHPATLKALERKGMIESYREAQPTGHGRLFCFVTRYLVPLPVHIRWCEWCSEQPDGLTPPSTDTPQRGERGAGEGE